jgi:glutathione peroxidase
MLSTITMGLLTFLSSCFSGKNKAVDINAQTMESKSIYEFKINSLDNTDVIDFSDFKGKKILIVNTASKCGFTGQYQDLEKLHKEYKDKLVIIGCPCNQFGGQEPGTPEDIAEFCKENYGVSFRMTEKLNVKGENQHPLYRWLTNKSLNGADDFEVKWNFNKFLINENGQLTNYFGSTTKPYDEELIAAINN